MQPKRRPLIMGVLNTTPDSFSDGGSFVTVSDAIARAHEMVEQGADIIDVGGESSRPGALAVPEAEELRRVVPLIRALKKSLSIPISVDTVKLAVMRESRLAGADIVNDINALQGEGAVKAVSGATVCLMHMQGQPATMQNAPQYDDVVHEVFAFLQQRLEACVAAGMNPSNIWLDPGFGFGKTVEQNFLILKRLAGFKSLGCKILVGMSRKSMLGAVTGRDIRDRKAAGIAAAVMALQNGADIIRTHDVAETRDAIKVWCACELGEYDGHN